MAASNDAATKAFVELQQFLAQFCSELDNDGKNVTRFYFPDGVFSVGGQMFQGHEGITKFYADRLERVRASGEVRTSRHTFLNLHVSLQDDGKAVLSFINITFAGAGPTPVMGLLTPAVLSDCRMKCARDTDGGWRIERFEGQAAFVGTDPLMNKMAVKQ